jgi:hypothetical protein
MYRNLLLWLCLLLASLCTVMAEAEEPAAKVPQTKKSAAKEPAAKELSGMSIVGNDEAPKSLYIVPWKSSEIGAETDLNMLLDENAMPVDRDVFMRQLNFYEISTKK